MSMRFGNISIKMIKFRKGVGIFLFLDAIRSVRKILQKQCDRNCLKTISSSSVYKRTQVLVLKLVAGN